MRSRSFSILAVTTAALMFGALTDEASSHKLSSLAVRAFDGVVGTAIELVRPSSPERAKQQSTASARPAAATSSVSALESPALARTNPVGATSFETTLATELPATVIESEAQPDEDAASGSSGQQANFAFRGAGGARASLGGGASGSGAEQDASVDPLAQADTPLSAPATRLDALMDVVASELDRDYGASSTVGSPLDFTRTPSGSTSGSLLPEPSTGPGTARPIPTTDSSPISETGQPASSSPTPVVAQPPTLSADPGLVLPADVSTSPTAVQPSGNPVEGAYPPVTPFDIVPTLSLDELVPNPAGSSPDLVDEFLILPSNIAPPGLIAPAPATDVQFALETPGIVNPEPATLVLFGTGLALVARSVRRRHGAAR